MTSEQPSTDGDDPETLLSDPMPATGDHPGGPRAADPPFSAIADRVADHLATDSSGHDLDHVWRVFRLGTQFAAELDADVEVVGAAALTHDLHRVRGEGGGVDPAETTDEVREILAAVDFPAGKIPAVTHCVAVHDEYEYAGMDRPAESVEAEILRDADNLDAIGAIGIGRTFMYGASHGTPMWDPDGVEYSQLYHFEDKLLRLVDEMNTAPARRLAEGRHAFTREFFEQFREEWHGEA